MALAFVAEHNGEHAAEEVAGFLEYTGDFRSVLQPNHPVQFELSTRGVTCWMRE